MVLLHSNAFRVPHFKPCEQDIQGRLVFLIFLPDFRSRQHFHHHGEVLFLRRRFMHQVQHQRLQKRCFGFRPERVRALCSGRSGGLDEGFDEAKNILVIPHISKGVIAKGGVGVQQIKHPHLISVRFERTACFSQDFTLWIADYQRTVAAV